MSQLLELKTDLKSLKFGNDRPENGSSGLPYIQTQVPPTPYLLDTTGPGFPIYKPGSTGNLDYPIRGGQIKFQIGQDTYTVSSQIDHARIIRFLKDEPRGSTFITKQIGLQLSNPKIETSATTSFGFGEPNILPGLIENTRVYNSKASNTLAQVLASGTGAHAIRHGTVPFAQFQKNYYYTVNEQNIIGGESGTVMNRLVLLNDLKMGPGSNFINVNPNIDINRVNTLGISLNKNIIFQYLGGPGSAYGIGSTSIARVVDTSNLYLQNPLVPDAIKNNYEKYGRTDIDGNLLTTGKLDSKGNTIPPLPNRLQLLYENKILGNTILGDVWGIGKNQGILFFYNNGPGSITKGEDGKFTVDKSQTGIRRYVDTTKVTSTRTMVYSQLADRTPQKEGKNKKLMDFRKLVSTDTPMGTWKDTESVDYRFYVKNTHIDKLNVLFPIEFSNDKAPWELPIIDGKSTDDIIKFVFEAINNDDSTKSTALFFRAHLNGSITDNNSGTWNNFKYIGRGEDFYTYQGFTRTIGFSFRAYAASVQEIKPMYSRLNALVSQVYPDYSESGIMRAPMMRLTIGDYFYRMPGFLESINLSIDQNSSWETLSDDVHSQLPHMVDVSISFKPVLTELPRRANQFKTPYAPSIIANNGKTIFPFPSNQSPIENAGIQNYVNEKFDLEYLNKFAIPIPDPSSTLQKELLDRRVNQIDTSEDFEETDPIFNLFYNYIGP